MELRNKKPLLIFEEKIKYTVLKCSVFMWTRPARPPLVNLEIEIEMHSATWTASECQPGKAIPSCPSGLSSVDSIHLSTHFRDISNHNRLPWGTSLTAFWRWCGLSGAAHQQGQNVYRAVLASFGFNELPRFHLVWEQKFPLGHSVPQLKRSLV